MELKDKVITGLECCIVGGGVTPNCEECPYVTCGDDTCDSMDVLFGDALVLLNAQDAKLVHVTADINHRKIGECPTCGKWINSGDYPNYCGRCGQAVKWE